MQLPIASGAGRPEPRAFRPNLGGGGKAAATPVLAAPPQVAANANPRLALPVASGAATRAQPRAFVLPGTAGGGKGNGGGNGGAPAVAPPPQLASGNGTGSLPGGIGGPARPQPRALVLPGGMGSNGRGQASAPQLDAPRVSAGGAPSGALTLAVVGLNPTERLTAPLPEGSRNARFSAGPQTRANGGDGEPVESARVFVPDLMVRNGPPAPNLALMASAAPTSPENLRQAARMAPRIAPPEPSREQIATRVTGAPAPILEGRVVYSMTVQMPNVTSYTGSWLIWFAERGARRGADRKVAAPVPRHKVDPKYVASAAADRVQGTVRLSAVIRSDGSVESVALLTHLDERLDRSAEEALRKWQFQPARRAGAPIDVDAVIDIPFRLAPSKVRWCRAMRTRRARRPHGRFP
jgi:TonB family protein